MPGQATVLHLARSRDEDLHRCQWWVREQVVRRVAAYLECLEEDRVLLSLLYRRPDLLDYSICGDWVLMR